MAVRGWMPLQTYDNEAAVRQMVQQQRNLLIPTELIPVCPLCGKPMTMNLRSDNDLVEDDGWHAASARYEQFLQHHGESHILYLELGVGGGNTPGIIKYPFWKMTQQNPEATYACINFGEAIAPHEIKQQSVSTLKQRPVLKRENYHNIEQNINFFVPSSF